MILREAGFERSRGRISRGDSKRAVEDTSAVDDGAGGYVFDIQRNIDDA